MNWIPYGKTWREFRQDGLIGPGVCVRLLPGPKEYMIGDHNNVDDESTLDTIFRPSSIVESYCLPE